MDSLSLCGHWRGAKKNIKLQLGSWIRELIYLCPFAPFSLSHLVPSASPSTQNKTKQKIPQTPYKPKSWAIFQLD